MTKLVRGLIFRVGQNSELEGLVFVQFPVEPAGRASKALRKASKDIA